ncbi:hypothetical protein I7I48_03344 [Histoplasma ohiense]|nr:hypothetical protein I7I48_03344 [Histoplasma ohiense (nom. inval.)]
MKEKITNSLIKMAMDDAAPAALSKNTGAPKWSAYTNAVELERISFVAIWFFSYDCSLKGPRAGILLLFSLLFFQI